MEKWLEGLKDTCHALGIEKGDILYISSDITMLMYRVSKTYSIKTKEAKKEFMNKFVDTLKEMVGEQGTLLVPMFTWSFCRGVEYDARSTPGEVGALGNWILDNRTDFRRTKHPLYSFMVTGKDADLLYNMENKTAWGADSPFSYLHHNHGKNLLINVTLERCFTFTHYVEECLKVPYRYFKDFSGTYIDENGNKSNRTYTMYVRDLAIESRQVTPDDCLDKAGVAVSSEHDHNTLKLVDLEKSYPVVEDNYLYHNGSDWYDFGEYRIAWKEACNNDR